MKAEPPKIYIPERLTFDTLYRYSEPKRVVRSLTVRGPPLKISANEDSVYWAFNFKAFPSTTGLRHQGYIKFLKPPSQRPLEHVDCIVDCDCLAADTLVLMADGTYKPISEVKAGELVYTHKGRIRRVEALVSRPLREGEKVYEIGIQGFPYPVKATGGHPFYALRNRMFKRGHHKPTNRISDETIVGVLEFYAENSKATFKQIAKKFGISKSSVSNIISGKLKVEPHRTASDHPDFQWVKVEDFREKEWLLTPEGYLRRSTAKNEISGIDQVYCLVVEEDQSFIAHGVSVANCADFRYRWAWSNKQRGSSHVGPGSMNGALNRAPRVTNPQNVPGLCKHLLALKDYIYGTLSTLQGAGPDDGKLLSKLVKYANNKWANMPEEIAKARERDRRAAQARAARNRGERLPPRVEPQEQPDEQPDIAPTIPGIPTGQVGQPTPKVGEEPSAKVGSDKEAEEAKKAGFNSAAEHNFRRKIGDSLETAEPVQIVLESFSLKNIVIKDEMKTDLLQSIQILEELDGSSFADQTSQVDNAEDNAEDTAAGPDVETSPEDEPSEALDLLRQMVDLLKQMVDDQEIPEEDGILPDEEPERKGDPGTDFEPQMKGSTGKPKNPAGPNSKPQF